MKIKYFLPNNTIDKGKNKFLVFLKNFFNYLIKLPLRWISRNINYENTNKITSYSLNNKYFKNVKNTKFFKKRDQLWIDAFDNYINKNDKIVFIEFGVYEGKSIKVFSDLIKNPKSKIFGFDTFSGMPEKWNQVHVGAWSTSGKFPNIQDNRIEFVKGLFQDTLNDYLEKFQDLKKQNYTFVIHLDADLYSSTLFVLSKLSFLDEFFVFFDEFSGDENRALKSFLEAYYFYNVKFYSHTKGFANEPHKVFTRIFKRKN
tara:strand:+ start:55 stop:828 length:774 start_codon:yes stop_codon:yes gene_type:complete